MKILTLKVQTKIQKVRTKRDSKLVELYNLTKEQIKGKSKNEISKIWKKYNIKKTDIKERTKQQIEKIKYERKLEISQETFSSYKKVELANGYYELFSLKHFKRLLDNKQLIDDATKKILERYTDIKFIHLIIQYNDENWSGLHPVISDAYSMALIKREFIQNKTSLLDLLLQKKDSIRNKKSDFEIDNVENIILKVIHNETINANQSKKTKGRKK